MDEAREGTTPGLGMPIAWALVALVVSAAACLGVGFAAADSETAGVNAAWFAAFPFCAAWSAALGAVAVHLAIRGRSPARGLAPVGCGCLGGALGLAATAVFFFGVFPAL